MRLVDVDAEIKKREKLCEEKKCEFLKYRYQAMCKGCPIYEEIEAFDSAEEVEAELVRHGRLETWGYVFHGIEWKRCSECGKPADISYNAMIEGRIEMSTPEICSCCGCKMNGGE